MTRSDVREALAEAYRRGVEDAAKWLRGESIMVRRYGVSYSTECMKRALLSQPSVCTTCGQADSLNCSNAFHAPSVLKGEP